MTDHSQSEMKRGVALPTILAFTGGFAVWILAVVVTGALGHPQWWEVISKYWVLNFLAGAVAMAAILTSFALRGQLSSQQFFAVAGAYMLPVAILVMGWGAVGSIYLYPARDEALRDFAPVIMMLTYGLGLVFGWTLLAKRSRDFLVASALPPIVMAVVALGYFSFGTFTSDAFRFRDAFSFGLLNASREGDELRAECLFTIRKADDYVYMVSPVEAEADQPGEIIWPDGKGAPTTPGQYRVTLVWRGTGSINVVPNSFQSDVAMESAPVFGIKVRTGKGERVVKTFPIPVDGALTGS